MEGRALSFTKGKGFFADLEIKFDLPDGPLEGKEWPSAGHRSRTRPSLSPPRSPRPAADRVTWPGLRDDPAVTKQTAKEMPGTIELRANKPPNTTLRGTFSATRKKTTRTALDADDAPYIQGRITFVGPWAEEAVGRVRRHSRADGKAQSNMAGTAV